MSFMDGAIFLPCFLGGWGWIVMLASLCCNCIVDGIVFSSGILLDDIAKEFDITKAKVRSYTSSLLVG